MESATAYLSMPMWLNSAKINSHLINFFFFFICSFCTHSIARSSNERVCEMQRRRLIFRFFLFTTLTEPAHAHVLAEGRVVLLPAQSLNQPRVVKSEVALAMQSIDHTLHLLEKCDKNHYARGMASQSLYCKHFYLVLESQFLQWTNVKNISWKEAIDLPRFHGRFPCCARDFGPPDPRSHAHILEMNWTEAPV